MIYQRSDIEITMRLNQCFPTSSLQDNALATYFLFIIIYTFDEVKVFLFYVTRRIIFLTSFIFQKGIKIGITLTLLFFFLFYLKSTLVFIHSRINIITYQCG